MKKYVKPDLYYESFELNYAVATCSLGDISITQGNAHSETTCEFDIGAGIMLFHNNTDCNYDPHTDSAYERYCYQTQAESLTFFAS